MEYLPFIIAVTSLIGFASGVFGSVVHQHCQRRADKKRWEELRRLD